MPANENHKRMINRDKKPTTEDILDYIGRKAKPAWDLLMLHVKDSYDIQPETVFYGTNYGWLVRYRKSNKTLCSFFPEMIRMFQVFRNPILHLLWEAQEILA